jgi:hypothetical protein
MGGKPVADVFVFAPWNLRARRESESGYEAARAASLASREYIEQSSILAPHVLLCHNSTTTQTYREGARVAELRIGEGEENERGGGEFFSALPVAWKIVTVSVPTSS